MVRIRRSNASANPWLILSTRIFCRSRARLQAIADGQTVMPLIEGKNVKCNGTPFDVEVQSLATVFDGEPAVPISIRDISAHSDQMQALAVLRDDPAVFDLVLTEYNMPGMSGLDVAIEVRAIRADLPVAIATGFIDEYLRAQADSAGVRELLFKANINDEFCDAVTRLIDSSPH